MYLNKIYLHETKQKSITLHSAAMTVSYVCNILLLMFY